MVVVLEEMHLHATEKREISVFYNHRERGRLRRQNTETTDPKN
jgi:hypothetical protein